MTEVRQSVVDIREDAGFPPPEAFVLEVNRRLSACLLILRFLPAPTRRLIADEIVETERLITAIRTNLDVLGCC